MALVTCGPGGFGKGINSRHDPPRFPNHQQTNLKKMVMLSVLAGVVLAGSAVAQTFQRAAACPNLGCIYPPVSSGYLGIRSILTNQDQVDFIAGRK
jgi:hypothetical protein